MQVPATVEDFLALGYKSGLLEPAAVAQYREQHPVAATVPRELADALVRGELLTRFQADCLLAGKWKGFLIAGKYRLLHKIGSGGMGHVYLCEHVRMKRRVALKVLPLLQADDPAAVKRFELEARAVAALDHPNIVRAHDVDNDSRLHFIVLEYVDGNNLHDIVRKHGSLSPVRAAHYIRQAAEGLEHAHAAGLVHRDLKPGNLLLDRNGTIKLLDMGLARFFHEEMDPLLQNQEVGNTLGTAEYVAPEQVEQSMVDIRADIYSLGCTFYFLLTGSSPFPQAKTMQEKLTFQQVRKPKPVRQIRPEIPEELAQVVDKMMAKDVNLRYQEPAEVVEALAPWTQAAIDPPSEEEMPPRVTAERGPGSSNSNRPGSSKVGPATPKDMISPITPRSGSPRPMPPSSSSSVVKPPGPKGPVLPRGIATPPTPDDSTAARLRAAHALAPKRTPAPPKAGANGSNAATEAPAAPAAKPAKPLAKTPAAKTARSEDADADRFASRVLIAGAGVFTAAVLLVFWLILFK